MEAAPNSKRVLLIDDSEIVVDLVAIGLEEHGWEVLVARSGVEGIDQLQAGAEPGVVVCDLHMPDMDGFAVLRRVGVIEPDLPVVILSGDEDLAAVLGAVRQGAFDYVLKSGADLGPLVAAMDRALAHYRILKDNRRLSEALRGANEELAHRLSELDDRHKQLQLETAERKEAQRALGAARDQALAASRAKSAFLANMSHELRTPLNAILGYAEILEEDAEEIGAEEIVPDLRKIHSAGKHLLELINDILDLSKIEAGKMSLYLETIDLRAMIDDVVMTVRPLVDKNNNELTVHLDPDLGRMHTDVTRVRQSLLNLLSNSSKFTDSGRIDLSIRRDRSPEGDWILFEVADTGIGMSPSQLSNLFQEFEQGDGSTTRKYGGTGLGLAISKRLCVMMGGEITAASEQGRGSTFTIRLPASQSTAATQQTGEYVGNDDSSAAKITATRSGVDDSDGADVPGGVLVIDDDVGMREMLRRYLQADGFQVHSAENGEHGIALAGECRPGVILLDVTMPKMDGWSTLAQLKRDPVLRETPVIMVTRVDDHSRGIALGASDYLTKPVDKNRLIEVVRRLGGASPGKPVMVVEDSPETRELLSRMLRGEGWDVIEAANGRAALQLLKARIPALILLDLMMPEVDGFRVVSELQGHDEWRHIPVVVVTAMDLPPEQRQMLEGHVKAVFHKGDYRLEGLLQEIRTLVHANLGGHGGGLHG